MPTIPISVLEQLQTISSAIPKTGGANTTNDVLLDRTGNNVDGNLSIAYRVIQNCSGATINVSFGTNATVNTWHVQVPDGQQLQVNTLERVSVYCASAWTVAVIEQNRLNGGI